MKNLTNLTYWPQPAFILPVKICKNPVFGIKKLQETGSTSSQKSSQIVGQDRHRAKNRAKKWIRIDIEPKSGETRGIE